MQKEPVGPDEVLSIGGNDVQIEAVCSREDWTGETNIVGTSNKPTVRELDESLRTNIKFNGVNVPSRASEIVKKRAPPLSARYQSSKGPEQSLFKTPILRSRPASKLVTEHARPGTPKHDPTAGSALVMPRPKVVPKGKRIMDVVVDPLLSDKLRPHQREGVKFLYECIMGMRSHGGEGAILADDMGLGKTLQVITLVWTLLKQNPHVDEEPLAKKIMIVCPVSLIENWRKEFRKWLGRDRIGIFVVDDKSSIGQFTMGKAYSVMIIGYEKLRTIQKDLQKGRPIDLIVMDEGHRLKTAKNKSAQVIKALPSVKRIVLSGTPIQNDLSELYFVVDLVNPGLLGTAVAYKRDYEKPIEKSRQPEATWKEKEKGEEKYNALVEIMSHFMLRRTADILAEFLPSKTEYVLFCKPTTLQAQIYRDVLASPALSGIIGSSESAFQLISILKKLCNSPSLLKGKEESDEPARTGLIDTLLSQLKPKQLKSAGSSGKLRVLDSLLYNLRTKTDEKIVLVSNYTATLDILGKLLDGLQYTWVRLDGSTPNNKRMDLVEHFNRTNADKCFAFLLSAKSGGVGLNLIGASRLVLFDVDWNPSTDLQAMARIHRDGQKRPCMIYRLLTRGALDEKIYQRQLTKQSLADSVMDNKASASSFTKDELRNLFNLEEANACQTHELLGCSCGGKGALFIDETSAVSSPAEKETTIIGDDEGDELPSLPMLMTASQVNVEDQDRQYREVLRKRTERWNAGKGNGKSKMSALMQYQHVDVESMAGAELERLIDDEVLLHVLNGEENRVSYLFAKRGAVLTVDGASPAADSPVDVEQVHDVLDVADEEAA